MPTLELEAGDAVTEGAWVMPTSNGTASAEAVLTPDENPGNIPVKSKATARNRLSGLLHCEESFM
jgi:hypothetical protein